MLYLQGEARFDLFALYADRNTLFSLLAMLNGYAFVEGAGGGTSVFDRGLNKAFEEMNV